MKKYFILVLCFAMGIGSAKSQVTIGASIPPAEGALLDLKEESDGTSKKGLGLPCVELKNITQLTMGHNVIADAPTHSNTSTVWKDHSGLIVYNTGKNEVEGAARFCPGLHVWDGEKWNPIVPYADFSVQSFAVPTSDLIDNRGGESNTYHTARFHTVKVISGNAYACDESNAPTYRVYDAGIWMTQNLRTKKAPNGTDIPLSGSAGDGCDLAIYAYPRPSGVANSAIAL